MTEAEANQQPARRLPASTALTSAACRTPAESLWYREPAGNESQEASTSSLAQHNDGLTFLGVRVLLPRQAVVVVVGYR